MSCACGQNWIVEVCDFATGQVRTVWHPISIEWQTTLNQIGQGNVTMATGDLTVRDLWPGLTSVYISRINPGGPELPPIAEFGGIVWEFGAAESGTTVVGLKSIEEYLNHRVIDSDVRWDDVPQTEIARDLVRLAEPDGVPLFAEADESSFPRDREFLSWGLKNIGEAVEQLTEVINGPDWEIVHSRADGRWSSTMYFRDFVGEDRDVIVQSDREASAYSLSVSAENLATHVWAIGAGEEEDQLVAPVVDDAGIYPRFDAVPAWKDVNRLTTLYSHADGYLETNREPDARPTMTVSGLDPDPADLQVGDIIDARMGYGPIAFRGKARVLSVSWTLNPENPESRTLELLPLVRASESVLNQRPDDPTCKDC